MTIAGLKANSLSRPPSPGDFSNTATGSGTGYKYVSFTADGTLAVTVGGLFDILIIGGGAGGGGGSGSFHCGGGAGAMKKVTNFYLPAGSHTVKVGAGGAVSADGNPSYIGSFIDAVGGGHGGFDFPDNNQRGSAGGSGGGSCTSVTQGKTLDSRYGNDGGSASGNAAGGGAGGAASGNTAGIGLADSITGGSVTYAAGGIGGSGSAGTANTGNGGNNNTAGGSGIVIVRVNY